MKIYIELGLTALLAVLIYEKPTQLLHLAHNTLGKILLMAIVLLIAKYHGINAGIISALIVIVLFEHVKEDFSIKKSSKKEGFAVINGKLEKKNFEVSKKDMVGFDRDLKISAIRSFNASSQESGRCGKSTPFPK
jgi:hypothetical protein